MSEKKDSTSVKELKNAVVFYSFMNTRKKFYLPNIDNFFGPIQVEKIMIDTGCNSLLLNFKESNQINDLIATYPSSHQSRKMTDYLWRIAEYLQY